MKILERAAFLGSDGGAYKLRFLKESVNNKNENLYEFIHFNDTPSDTIIPVISLTQNEIDLISLLPDRFFDAMLKMYNNKHLMKCYLMLNDEADNGVELALDEKEKIDESLLVDEGVEEVKQSDDVAYRFSKPGDVYIINIWIDHIVLVKEDLERIKEMIAQYNDKSKETEEDKYVIHENV